MTTEAAPSARTASLSERVAEEIRALLGRRRMSQAALARDLKVTASWLNNRLLGSQPIDLNDLDRIAAALGVQPAALLSSPKATGESPSRRRRPRTDTADKPHPTRANARNRPPTYPRSSGRPLLVARHSSG